MTSMRWCGTALRSAALGLAVPMSRPRYTCAESIDTISRGTRSASASAMWDLPLAVGPSSAYALPATSDVEYCPAHIGRFLGCQPKNRPRNLLGLAGTLQRRAGADAVGALRISARGVDVGMDHAGPDGIDADA